MIIEICVGGVWSGGCCDGGGSVLYCYREPCIESLFQGWFGRVLGEELPCDQRDLFWWSVGWWLL